MPLAEIQSMIIVVPLTGAEHLAAPSPIDVLVKKGDGGIRKDSIVLTGQIRAVDFQRVRRSFGVLSPETMKAVDMALMISPGLARGGKA